MINKNHQFTPTHNKSGTRLYSIWAKMKYRCNNHNSPNFSRYGGRGIKYAKEWEEFIPFYEWSIKNGYREDLTLDRIDNNLDYTPDNCRWADTLTQGNNKRTNVKVKINNEVKTLAEWARFTGFKYVTIQHRYKNGDRGEKLIRPIEPYGRKRKTR
jgi:hypothetical protein